MTGPLNNCRNWTFNQWVQGDGRNYRIFAQGELWFDASKASLRLTTDAASAEIILDVHTVGSIPEDLLVRVQQYLHSI
jgi:hypothetical protein